jgi:hypothetical protein
MVGQLTFMVRTKMKKAIAIVTAVLALALADCAGGGGTINDLPVKSVGQFCAPVTAKAQDSKGNLLLCSKRPSDESPHWRYIRISG